MRALAACLHGKDFPNLRLSSALMPAAIGANFLPTAMRQQMFKLGGYFEAIAPERLAQVSDENIARFVVRCAGSMDDGPCRRRWAGPRSRTS